MTRCKYEYKSITDLTLAGIDFRGITGISSLNPLALAKLYASFSSPSGKLPLSFTLNLNVSNPASGDASLSRFDYIIAIDGIEMTRGALEQSIYIPAGGQSLLSFNIAFDLKQSLSGKSLDVIKNLALNFIGIGDKPSNVTFSLKPGVNVSGKTVISPNYIPISFTLNKK
jgi:hypothetical protein